MLVSVVEQKFDVEAKNQAFIEMEDMGSACKMVGCFSVRPPQNGNSFH